MKLTGNEALSSAKTDDPVVRAVAEDIRLDTEYGYSAFAEYDVSRVADLVQK